jgi:hypothetical protein
VFRQRRFLVVSGLAAVLQIWQAPVFAQQNPTAGSNTEIPSSPAKPDVIEIPLQPTPVPVAPSAPILPGLRIPNFSSCPIAELRQAVPALAGLKADRDQAKLAALLDNIGAKTVEIVRKTPNLISHEAVAAQQGTIKMHQDFSYLVLPHALGSKSMVLDEYRVDLKSGEKFQTEDLAKAAASDSLVPPPFLVDLPSSSRSLPESEAAPTSQGFVNGWLHFYPPNWPQSDFRYLGQQKMDGHHTLVVAFAQKPVAVRLPALFRFEDKTVPIFLQGVAWVDATDFRIVRLRTDLLSPPPGVPLRRLTADIQFAQVRIAETATPLWLPRQVLVTVSAGGVSRRESHTYSNYRLSGTLEGQILNP